MNTVAIIQARTGSTRLPNKIFAPLLGAPLLQHVVDRVRRARQIDHVMIATTTNPADDAVATFAVQQHLTIFRGSETDVLDRYYHAAEQSRANVIVRITADCPCIDPALIDDIIAAQQTHQVDYCSNVLTRTFPRGLDAEVFTRATLTRAWQNAATPGEREHVTPYIIHHPELFRLQSIQHTSNASHWRWTVDTPDDLRVIEAIYAHFGHNHFSWPQIAAWCNTHPDLANRNAHVIQKPA